MITVQPYTPEDKDALMRLMIELQGHVASIDPMHRIRTLEDFDTEKYIDDLLRTIERDRGILFVATEDNHLLGFIAGGIPQETEEDLLDHYPVREGKIYELVVSAKHRGQGTGRQLMEKMEEYFKEQNCEFIRVGCLAPNTATHAFYEKCGYNDRYVEMLKKIG